MTAFLTFLVICIALSLILRPVDRALKSKVKSQFLAFGLHCAIWLALFIALYCAAVYLGFLS